MSIFEKDIRFLKGVGEKRAEYLKAMGIDTIGALLRFFPRGYADFGKISSIFDARAGEKVCIKAKITTPIAEHYIRANMTLYKFNVHDGTGTMQVTIFNNKYLASRLNVGSEYLFLGKIDEKSYIPSMSSPEIKETSAEGIIPIYKASAKISSSAIEKLIKNALLLPFDEGALPQSIIEKYNLCEFRTAIENIHFPKNEYSLSSAKRHLVFEELFVLSAGLMLLKGKRRQSAGYALKTDYTKEFFTRLPFEATAAQKRATAECMRDLMSGKSMNRLVEGDVGSGKTVVAAALMFAVAKAGLQSAIMAPTEILAEQHYKTLCSLLSGSTIECVLLTGSTKKSEKNRILERLSSGEAKIAVGTHALISDGVEFKNLCLQITDEQHRFGVRHRAMLAEKGKNTHTLVMSATPIPRTLGLIIYGDLDISVIDEYPRGRQKIDSYLVPSELRPRVFNFIKQYLDSGRQGYIVCPMVEENEEINITSAEEYYEKIKNGEFKAYRVGLLHGKMKSAQKEKIMREFKEGNIDLLVCTTVIEVGIDVPNAAIMVVENSERFGLSQLHQLRGRIGRGEHKSSCVFISDSKAERLKVIKDNIDGFKIAEEDLRLRGPGDFLGSRQHGLPEFKIADIYADGDTLKLSRMAAAELLERDARLQSKDNEALRQEIIRLYKKLNEN